VLSLALTALLAVRSVPLSQGWLFQPDPLAKGDAQEWWTPGFDRSGWRPVAVPSAWDFYDPVMDGYEGVGWYALRLSPQQMRPGSWQRLLFGRVHHKATVWIDGHRAGENLTGYLPFEVPITPHVSPGKPAWVVVRVDNEVRYDRLPGTTPVEWVQYGGLLQPVELVTTSRTYLAHAAIRAAPLGDGATVAVEVEVAGTVETPFTGRVRVEVEKTAAEAEVRVDPGATVRVPLALRLPHARRWSPDSPALYEAKLELLDARGTIDTLREPFGVRTVEARGRQILLNGTPLHIRGVNRYDEFPGRGPVADAASIRGDLAAVKGMGANLIRVHYPQSPLTLRLADEMGLILMEEVPLNWWRAPWHRPVPPEFDNDAIVGLAESALEQLIRRDGNHPSVLIWSMANECETSDARGTAAMERLLRRARALDPTRLITYVANRKLEENRAFALADLVAFNLYYGMWDGDVAEDLSQVEARVHAPTRARLEALARSYPDKPLLLTEFGTIGVPGSKGDLRFSETYQAAYLDAVWQAVQEVPAVSGAIVWSWADYRHRKGFENDFPAFFGPFGVVTLDRRPKAAYAALHARWH